MDPPTCSLVKVIFQDSVLGDWNQHVLVLAFQTRKLIYVKTFFFDNVNNFCNSHMCFETYRTINTEPYAKLPQKCKLFTCSPKNLSERKSKTSKFF